MQDQRLNTVGKDGDLGDRFSALHDGVPRCGAQPLYPRQRNFRMVSRSLFCQAIIELRRDTLPRAGVGFPQCRTPLQDDG